ncbi:MAG: DUF1176 domain-containing protein [Pseudomonadota bacterium]
MNRKIGTLIAAILLAQSASADVAQQMRQWWVECGRQGYCTGEVNGFSNDNDVLTFRLQRSEAENAPILVIVKPEHLVASGNRVTFSVPGVSKGFSGKVGNVNDGEFSYSVPYDNPFIDALQKGRDLEISIDFEGELGQVTYRVPLAGAIESLTIMDVAQQRLGRVDAVVSRGIQPVDSWSDIFPSQGEETGGEDMGGLVEDQTAVADDDQGDAHMEEGPNGSWFDLVYEPSELPEVVRNYAMGAADCRDYAAAMNEMGAGVRRDQQARMWYFVPCQIGKANVSYFVVLHDFDNAVSYRLLDFELPITHNKPNRIKVLNPYYDNDRDLVVVTRYGNVNRNCGAYEEHQWQPSDQFLELQVYKAKKSCGGPQTRPQDFALEWTIDEMGQ